MQRGDRSDGARPGGAAQIAITMRIPRDASRRMLRHHSSNGAALQVSGGGKNAARDDWH